MITFDNVSFSYDKTPLIQNLSFTLPQQGVIGFSGPSGCGKTTLLRLITGLEKPKKGAVIGSDSVRFSVVFQENRLLPWLTAEENVRLACEETPSYAIDRLTAVSLSDAAEKYPSELSGGMQRRVALARAMARNGDILILDEPFTGLDETLRQDVARRLMEQFRDKLILLVTHDTEDFALFGCSPIRLSALLTGRLL